MFRAEATKSLGRDSHCYLSMASRVGFEPTTQGLKVPCSTTELPARRPKRTGPDVADRARGSGSVVDLRVDRRRQALAAQTREEVGGGHLGHLAASRVGGRGDVRDDEAVVE